MTATWKLARGADNKTFAEWGFTAPRMSKVNQGIGEATFDADGALADSEPVLAYGDRVKITKDGVICFQGSVVETPTMGDGPQEGISYRLADTWFDLDELVMQQLWNGEYTSHLIYNLNPNWSPASVRAVILSVIAYAAANGVSIQAGEVLPEEDEEWFPPSDEATDRSCGQVIRDQLKWIPHVTAWIDDSTEVPTFHCRRSNHCKTVTVRHPGSDPDARSWLTSLTAFGMRKRSDLMRPAVVFKYEVKNTVNGKDVMQFTTDKFPLAATGREPRALVQTFSVLGSSVTTLSVAVATEELNPDSVEWWKEHFPHLDREEVVGLEIKYDAGDRLTSFTRMLLPGGGQLAPWMRHEGGAFVAWAEDIIKAKVSYAVQAGDGGTQSWVVRDEPISLGPIIATDAESITYRTVASVEEADPIPQGLAKKIYDALAVPQWEGSVELVAEEVAVRPGTDNPPQTPALGCLLNIEGLKTEWATMGALVQRIDLITETGTMIVAFGPPNHLGAADLIQLMAVGRSRRRWSNPLTQQTGELGGSSQSLQLGQAAAMENGMQGVGQEQYLKVWKDDKIITLDAINGLAKVDFGGGKIVEINTDAEKWDKKLYVKEFGVCVDVNGVQTPMKALFIMSDPY